jgi:hypothetical protein
MESNKLDRIVSSSFSWLYKYLFSIAAVVTILNNLRCIHQRITYFAISPDEVMYSHVAWNVSRGLIIYKDFFDNHGPVHAFFNSIFMFLASGAEPFDVFILLRMTSFIFICSMGILVFLISKFISKSINFAFLATAVFFMWDAVINYGFEIRPDAMQSFLMLLGLLLFLMNYKSEKTLLLFLSGISFACMFFVQFHSIFFLFGFVIYALIEIAIQKEPFAYKRFGTILFGFISVFLIISIYFLINSGFNSFQLNFFAYNFDFNYLSDWTRNMVKELRIENFLKKDILLSILTLLSLSSFKYDNYVDRALLFCLGSGVLGYFLGFYPYYSFIFLPIASIFIANFIIIFLQNGFYNFDKPSVSHFMTLFAMAIIFYSNFQSGFKDINTTMLQYQKTQLEWAMKNLKREEKVAISEQACPAGVFNRDSRYYWRVSEHETKVYGSDLKSKDLINSIEKNNVRFLFAYPDELSWNPDEVKDYVKNNFRLMNLVEDTPRNCIWVRNDILI